MKKTYALRPEGKNPDRVLEAVKHEIRKYIKRERRRVPPEGVDYWDFDCKFGTTEDAAQVVHLAELTALMDGVAAAAGSQFYVEILAKPGHRKVRPAEAPATETPAVD
jgi:predicted N-acyltransferase